MNGFFHFTQYFFKIHPCCSILSVHHSVLWLSNIPSYRYFHFFYPFISWRIFGFFFSTLGLWWIVLLWKFVCSLTFATWVSHCYNGDDNGPYPIGMLGLNEDKAFRVMPRTWSKTNKSLTLLFFFTTKFLKNHQQSVFIRADNLYISIVLEVNIVSLQ